MATRDGDSYVVNGKKRSQTVAAAADIYVTYVKTSDAPEDAAKHRHLTPLIIEKGMPKFSIEKLNDLMGLDGIYNCYLDFGAVVLPWREQPRRDWRRRIPFSTTSMSPHGLTRRTYSKAV